MSDWKKHYLNLTETFRSAAEYKNLWKEWPALRNATPMGDGHPVLVLPGFSANDNMTSPLREALREKGYKAYAWNGGVNMGLDDRTADHLRARLEKIFKDNGDRKVTLIGHSLGGIYARELAREFPEMVRAVITIGTPFGAGIEKDAVSPALHALIEMLGGTNLLLTDADTAKRCLTPPPVPTTSIFSKEDGIAGWQGCLNPKDPQAENIEVTTSHIGLIWSTETFAIVLERLAQPEGSWKPHDAAANDTPPKNPGWKQNGSPDKNLFRKK